MTALRIDAGRLPPEILERIRAGEDVEIESDGEVIARLSPAAEVPRDPRRLWKRLAELPPLDEFFERDIAELDKVVHPQAYPAWE